MAEEASYVAAEIKVIQRRLLELKCLRKGGTIVSGEGLSLQRSNYSLH